MTLKASYMKLIDELGQDEVVPLAAGLSSEHVWHHAVDRWGLLNWILQMTVKAHVTRQLETLILRSERAHGLVGPHCPLCYSQKYQKHIIRKHKSKSTKANVVISPYVKYAVIKSTCKCIVINYYAGR